MRCISQQCVYYKSYNICIVLQIDHCDILGVFERYRYYMSKLHDNAHSVDLTHVELSIDTHILYTYDKIDF